MLRKKEQNDPDAKAVVSLYLNKIIQYCANYDLTTKNELERVLGALPAVDISMDEFLDETLDKKNIDKKALLNSLIKKYGLDNFSNKANAAIHAPEEGTQDHNLHKIF
jgi:hypothetical protein